VATLRRVGQTRRVRFAPLRQRGFRAVLIGQALSSLGNGLVPVAIAFAVLRLTGSTTDLGLVLTAEFTAELLLFLAGGVVADRISRKTVMVGADTVRFVSQGTLGLLLITGRPAILLIAALAVLQGLAGGIFTPAAEGLIPALVPPEDLQQANTLQSMAGSAMWVIGPAIGGVLVATVGPGWAILADSVTYAVNIAMLTRVDLVLPPREPQQSFVAEMRVGWREFRARSWYVSTTVSVAVLNMFVVTDLVLGPVACRRYYGGAEAWGAISASGGIGSVIGGFAAMRVKPRHPLRLGVPLMMTFALIPFALAARLPIALVCVLSGIGLAGPLAFNSIIYTTVHKVVPEHLLSRLIAYDYFLAYLLTPIGTVLAGPVSSAIGLRATFIVVGAVMVIGAPAILLIPSVRNLSDPYLENRLDQPNNAIPLS
jgi:MFS family permease